MPDNNENTYSLQEALANITESINALATAAGKIAFNAVKSIESVYSSIAKAIESIKVTFLSDEEKERALKSCEKWGSFGWTPHPETPISFYFDCPDDYKEADRCALKLCTTTATIRLLNRLKASKIPKKDFSEAVFNFENRQYKSCAMMLYAIIDGQVLKYQKRLKEKELRVCGPNAVRFLKKTLNEKTDINERLLSLLKYSCLLKCLEKFFEYGNDFALITNIANRNLVDHGMMNKPVRRKDCLKLFLLLYNLLEFIDDLTKGVKLCQ